MVFERTGQILTREQLMHPRLKTSKKWSPLPKEFLKQVESVFKQTFKSQIDQGKVVVDGRVYPEELLVSVGYHGGKGLRQSNFEVSIQYKKDKDNVIQLLNLSVDVAASLFEQYFASEDDHEFPRLWQEFDVENRPVFVQYTGTNSELESEANKLLGEFADEGLTGGDWEDADSPDEVKARLGIDPQEKFAESIFNEDDEAMADDLENDDDDDLDDEERDLASKKPVKPAPKKH